MIRFKEYRSYGLKISDFKRLEFDDSGVLLETYVYFYGEIKVTRSRVSKEIYLVLDGTSLTEKMAGKKLLPVSHLAKNFLSISSKTINCLYFTDNLKMIKFVNRLLKSVRYLHMDYVLDNVGNFEPLFKDSYKVVLQ